ncbi:feruloyl-CoA synthase [Paraburkholderia sacchari]|uniref:feruloyl-CoA synthase n=1 Tax=Paraburkholderia sacchari TaxID=159450 RepID=UPI0005431441|nr:feruloyl-CoA synthase [Paraburkholderia sacchari]NLP60670.1 feruloyl-CoA synthase [Paraburkholderia sacchari]
MNMAAEPDLAAAPWRTARFPERQIQVEHRADGTLILRTASKPAALPHLSFAGFIPHWAAQRGDTPALSERDAHGAWRSIDWRTLWQQVQSVAAGLLELGLGQQRPVMLLSGNSIEQAVLLLAAEYVGIPTAPVSPAYATLSKDFARLKGVAELVPPGAIFVQATPALTRALEALSHYNATVIAVASQEPGQLSWQQLAATPLTEARLAAVARAHAALRRDDTARVLFTSGSTGVPKGVALTYRNFHAVASYYADNLGWLNDAQPVFLDWLPWHHGLGGVLNLGRSIQFGAQHYIDDGRPLPGMIERTVRNLREVSPTIFTSVPSAWAVLANELERDPALARSLFANARCFGYGGASLPVDVWQRIERVAVQTVGERIMFCSGLASTETTGMGTYCSWPTESPGNIGTPVPGVEVKLCRLEGGDGRYEFRMRGDHIFGGYIAQPELTAAAFDDEGFFRLGDAVRLVAPPDPAAGMVFAGRVAEDFKLANGTWVRTGAVRLALLEQCAPLLSDAVICGHDHDYLAALAWPNAAACKRVLPELDGLDMAALAKHPALVAELQRRLAGSGSGAHAASLRVQRLMLMEEPPSMDAGEIADKGYVNQALTRARRAHLVAALFENTPADHVARAH